MWLVLRAADDGDARRLADVERELRIPNAARRRRMVAIAVRVEIAVSADVAHTVLNAGRLEADIDRVVAAGACGKADHGLRRPVLGVHRNDAPRGISIERRE